MASLIFSMGERAWRLDLRHPLDLSIPLRFDGPQPNTYGVLLAHARAYEGGGFVGDVRRGGACNFETLTLTPHCNGTHTEGVGHLSVARIPVQPLPDAVFIPTTLVTVRPEPALTSPETYRPAKAPGDWFITRRALEAALREADPDFLRGLVIRTLPNDPSKQHRDYTAAPPPFCSLEAIAFLNEVGVEHLLVDVPSLDRLFDEGRLTAHHHFWGVPEGSHTVDPATASRKTITELVYADDALPDGLYLLTLQVAPFISDAAPSRPILFPLQPLPEQP
jgi:hypothetical protein